MRAGRDAEPLVSRGRGDEPAARERAGGFMGVRLERSPMARLLLLALLAACAPRLEIRPSPPPGDPPVASATPPGPVTPTPSPIAEPTCAEPTPPTAEPTPPVAEPPVPKTRSSKIPEVHQEPVTIGPSYSTAAIRRVILRADFSRCGAGRRIPPATYEFTIEPDGTVSRAMALDATAARAPECAAEVLRGLTFPTNPAPLTVRYPVR